MYIFSSFIDGVKETTFFTDCTQTWNKLTFLFALFVTWKLLSLQCFPLVTKHREAFTLFFFFFLKWRKRKECLRVLKIIWDKTQGDDKIKYLGDFCMLKKNITRKLRKEESETKPLGAGLQWPLHELLNYGYKVWVENGSTVQTVGQNSGNN